MSRFIIRWGFVRPQLDPWTTLNDLRELTRHHCTPGQFDDAVAIMGNDPYSVASYLCSCGLITVNPPSGSETVTGDNRETA